MAEIDTNVPCSYQANCLSQQKNNQSDVTSSGWLSMVGPSWALPIAMGKRPSDYEFPLYDKLSPAKKERYSSYLQH